MSPEEVKQRLHMVRAALILADRQGYEVAMDDEQRYVLVSEPLTHDVVDAISYALDHMSKPLHDPNDHRSQH